MGGVVAADLTCEYQRRQQDLVYTEADDQHLKASSFTTFTPPCLRHILLPALPIRPVTEPLGSKSKAVGPKPDPASLGVQPAGELLGSGAAIRIMVGRAAHRLVGADGRGYARRRQAAARRMEHALAEEPGIEPAPRRGPAPAAVCRSNGCVPRPRSSGVTGPASRVRHGGSVIQGAC